MSILNELTPTEGFVSAPGRKSYKPQEDMIFNGTIMENILFGEKFYADKYKAVLQACCLEKVISLVLFFFFLNCI